MENTKIREELLQQFACLLEDWIPTDARLAIALNGHYIFSVVPGLTVDKRLEGQPVQGGSIAERVMMKRKKTGVMVDMTIVGNSCIRRRLPDRIKRRTRCTRRPPSTCTRIGQKRTASAAHRKTRRRMVSGSD